jgi:hypothetical protein
VPSGKRRKNKRKELKKVLDRTNLPAFLTLFNNAV